MPSAGDETPHQRLGRIIRDWMTDRGITDRALMQAGGPDRMTLKSIVEGDPKKRQRHVIDGLEQALGWTPGSYGNTLAGGYPTTLDDGSDLTESEKQLLARITRAAIQQIREEREK